MFPLLDIYNIYTQVATIIHISTFMYINIYNSLDLFYRHITVRSCLYNVGIGIGIAISWAQDKSMVGQRQEQKPRALISVLPIS